MGLLTHLISVILRYATHIYVFIPIQSTYNTVTQTIEKIHLILYIYKWKFCGDPHTHDKSVMWLAKNASETLLLIMYYHFHSNN